MGAVVFGLKADNNNPLLHEAGILSHAHVPRIIVADWEDEVVQRATAPLELREQGLVGWLDDLEMHVSFGLMLHDDSAIPDPTAGDYVTDADLGDVAAAQLAIGSEVKERSVPKTLTLIKPKSNGPNLLLVEGALCAPHTSLIPRA